MNFKSRFFSIFSILMILALSGCTAASASASEYTVRPGDTLAKIAQANGTTVEKLVELNEARYPSLETNPGAIEVGWKLALPVSSVRVTISTPSANGVSAAPTAAPLDRDAFENEIVRMVNEERVKAGLAPLQVDAGLMQFARQRSEDMVKRGYFDHKDPVTGQDLTPDAGENISKQGTRWNNPRIRVVVDGWMGSEGHRNNILRDGVTKTGVGVAIGSDYIIVTQLFKY